MLTHSIKMVNRSIAAVWAASKTNLHLLVMDNKVLLIFPSFSSCSLFSCLVSDLQHPVVGVVPFGEGSRGSASTVQRGERGVSGQTGANHRRPEQDALPEGRHKGDVTVGRVDSSGSLHLVKFWEPCPLMGKTVITTVCGQNVTRGWNANKMQIKKCMKCFVAVLPC